MADKAYLERLARELTDQGKLIEAGWIGLRIAAIPLNASATQLDDMRNAFFAGAQHLFGSIMTVMDPDVQPTEKDVERLTSIARELRGFIADFKLRHQPAEGVA